MAGLTKEERELRAKELAKQEKKDFDIILNAQKKRNEFKVERIRTLMDDIKDGDIVIPEYQRGSLWTRKVKSKLIESILLGYFVPGLILAYNEECKLDLVDGRTRSLAIKSFLDNEFSLSKLTQLPSLNGKKFSDLKPEYQKIIKTFEIQLAIVHPSSLDEIRDLFVRINCNSVKLKPQEIANAQYMGDVVRLTKELANDEDVKEVIPITQDITRQQFVSRLLSLMYYGEMKGGNVQESILNFYKDTEKTSTFELKEMKDNFIDILTIIGDMDCEDLYSNKVENAKSFVRAPFEEYTFASIFALVMEMDDDVLKNKEIIKDTIISIRENEKSIFEISYQSHTTSKEAFVAATSYLIEECKKVVTKVA